MNLQPSQLEAINGNQKEATDGRGAGISETRFPEEKILQLSQRHCKLGDIIVVQLEGAPAASSVAVDLCSKRDQVAKHLYRGGEGCIDVEKAPDVQAFQGSLHPR